MGYRDDLEAMRTKRAAIAAAIAHLEPEVAARDALAEQLARLRRQRDEIDARIEPRVQTWASGWEWLALVAVVVWLACGAFIVIANPYGCHGGCHWNSTRSDAQAVRSAVLLYLGQEPGAACPTVDELVRSGVIDRARRTKDAWDHPFRIVCDGDDIRVTSAGPDGRFGPYESDDIE